MTWFLFGYALMVTIGYFVREFLYRRDEGQRTLENRVLREEILQLRKDILFLKAELSIRAYKARLEAGSR